MAKIVFWDVLFSKSEKMVWLKSQLKFLQMPAILEIIARTRSLAQTGWPEAGFSQIFLEQLARCFSYFVIFYLVLILNLIFNFLQQRSFYFRWRIMTYALRWFYFIIHDCYCGNCRFSFLVPLRLVPSNLQFQFFLMTGALTIYYILFSWQFLDKIDQ